MASEPDAHDLQAILDDIHRDLSPRFGEGKVATYIPQLARVDPARFGMAALQRVGELTMENELLRAKMGQTPGPLARRRWR